MFSLLIIHVKILNFTLSANRYWCSSGCFSKGLGFPVTEYCQIPRNILLTVEDLSTLNLGKSYN